MVINIVQIAFMANVVLPIVVLPIYGESSRIG